MAVNVSSRSVQCNSGMPYKKKALLKVLTVGAVAMVFTRNHVHADASQEARQNLGKKLATSCSVKGSYAISEHVVADIERRSEVTVTRTIPRSCKF